MRYRNYVLAFIYLIFRFILIFCYLMDVIDISKDTFYLGEMIGTGLLFIILAIPNEKD